MKLASISVDIDEIPCYSAIHGIQTPRGAEHAVYDRALPRLARLFAEENVPATFFAIGRDIERNAGALGALHAAGHELANHSESHFYDLTRRDPSTIGLEIARAGERLTRITGRPVEGFRAPGYTITDVVFDALGELGYRYDSSVFPCPAYFGAKALAIGAIRVRGRRSRSIVDDPRVLTAPADPYRVGRPYWRRGNGVLEMPIGVTRDLTGRLPYIGTSVVMSGASGARLLTSLAAGRPHINLELHGIDLADADEDGLSWLEGHQPDLKRSAASKAAALTAAIGRLREHGYELVTLAEAARRLSQSELNV